MDPNADITSSKAIFTPPMWAMLLTAVAAAACWPAMMIYPNEYDSSIFLWMGQRMWAGDLPYRDMWDNKLPLLYWINAAAGLFGSPKIAIYVMQSLAVAGGGLLIYGIGRRLFDEWPGRVASLAYVTLAGSHATLMTGNLTENWAAPFLILCVYSMLRYVQDDRALLRWPILSGLGMGFAACLRQPALLVGATLFTLLPAMWRARRITAAAIMGWLLGLLIMPLLIIVWARLAGVFSLMLQQCIAFNLAYGTSASRPDWANWTSVWERFKELLRQTRPWHATAVVGVVIVVLRSLGCPVCLGGKCELADSAGAPAGKVGLRTIAAMVLVWTASAGLSALPSLRFYTHHYYLTVAPLALLCGVALAPLFSNRARRTRWRPIAGAAVAVLLVLLVAHHFDKRIGIAAQQARWLQPVAQAGDFLQRNIDRGSRTTQSLYVFAWGGESDLLARLAMPSPTPHVMVIFYTELHTGREMIAQWRDDMLANPPDWLVCREDMDLVADHNLPPDKAGRGGRWARNFDWDRQPFAGFCNEIHTHYARMYDRVAAFGHAGQDQPEPGRLIIYRKRAPWRVE